MANKSKGKKGRKSVRKRPGDNKIKKPIPARHSQTNLSKQLYSKGNSFINHTATKETVLPELKNKSTERVISKEPTVEIKQPTANAIIVDTNILIHDPESINVLREGGKNTLFIPLQVYLELDNLKTKPDIGIDARDSMRLIEKIIREERQNGNSKFSLQIIEKTEWSGLEGLPQAKPDCVILATANWVLNNKKEGFKSVKMLSRDSLVRTLGINYLLKNNLVIEDYYQDQSAGLDYNNLPEINVNHKLIKSRGGDDFWFDLDSLNKGDKKKVELVAQNGGVVCFSDWNGDFHFAPTKNSPFKASFAAIRKDNRFKIIDTDISAFNIKQYSINGDGPNWAQVVALAQLLDPEISAVFMAGGAGTGKTLLAMAAALEQLDSYDRILVSRPAIHLSGEDNHGFLPGDLNKKMSPWLKPIWQALDELKEKEQKTFKHLKYKYDKNRPGESNLSFIEELRRENKLSIESLDYIRGQSIRKSFIVIDEGQNLTPHQIKTIITRSGTGTKIVFTGDLSQIDRRYLDRRSSGLAYAIERLTNIENLDDGRLAQYVSMIGAVNFKDSVRSDLARYAEMVL